MTKSMPYKVQLNEKLARIEKQFSSFTSLGVDVFTSQEWNFRQRAEFRIWHEGDESFYVMFEPGQKPSAKTLKRTDQLPIASKEINSLMPTLLSELKKHDVLIRRLYQVEFLSTLSGEMLVTLIYHRPLCDIWQEKAKPLEELLGVYLIGRSRGQKITFSQDFVTEKLTIDNEIFQYRQIEGGFTQPNAEVCQKMITWACGCAKEIGDTHDLLELYCGNANFTLPLSKHFKHVLATEVSKTSVNAGRHNINANQCNNIAIARLSAEELTEAMTGKREFRRLMADNIQLSNYDCQTIFVDPPRSGVDDDTLKMMQNHKHILYISCNPDTLQENLEKLTLTHEIKRIAMFDQFPYTHHVEMGAWLEKR